nr:DUF5590 domain-containing protein [Brevibacillus fulvus]
MFLGVAVFVSHLVSSVVGDKRAMMEQARQWALERTNITEIEQIDEYRGKQTYAVVIGKNRVGTREIAWLTKDQIVFDTMEHAIPRENVEAAVRKGFPQSEILRIVPGMEGQQRFWEVTLLDPDGKYRYLHYDFYQGNVTKSYVVQTIDYAS